MITHWPTAKIDEVWPFVADGLAESLANCGGDMMAGQLWQGLRGGGSHLLVAHDGDTVIGASVWRPEVWPTGPKLRCLALYGNRDMLTDMRATAERIARLSGATSLVSEGRVGWQKFFPNAKRLRILYEEPI